MCSTVRRETCAFAKSTIPCAAPTCEGGSMCSTIHVHSEQVDAGIASSRLYIKQSRELMQQLVLHPCTRTPTRAKAGLGG